MKVYIFAIGGTGARVLRSLAYCLASGMQRIPNGTSFIPMIIDYDKTNGDKLRTERVLTAYRQVRQYAYNGVTPDADDRSFFMPAIESLNGDGNFEFVFGADAAATRHSFSDNIGYTDMIGPTSLTRDLLASLYNDEQGTDPTGKDNPMAELNLNLSVGFRGNPNIGSLVFESLKKTPEFQQFKRQFDPAQDRVFIVSSVFGGTGSSGFPRIVDAIRKDGTTGYNTCPIGASIVLPYYDVATPQAGGAINSQIFNSKEKAALSYYNVSQLFQRITRSYFVGDSERTTLDYSEGSDTQLNDAHFAELLAALAVVDFASTPDVEQLGQQLDYGISANKADTDPLTLRELGRGEVKDSYQYLARMAVAFRYYREWVCTDAIPAKTAYYAKMGLADKLETEMFQPLDIFTHDFDSWLDELAAQKDLFKPFLQKPRDAASQQPVADDLNDYLNGYDAKTGGLFSSGCSYKDFDSYTNKYYQKYGASEQNADYALLTMYYDAAADCYSSYKPV